ncbi:MAG: hypothetical protein M1821_007135 [Bathelium mastoideum]|nr:MAG: hypothetical protein M1821_007135 [Bathelium mastoideum]
MSRDDIYSSFRSSPSTDALSDRASLIYVPTLTTINEPTAILKHLATQEKLLKKINERVLSSISGQDGGACYETEITIEFVAGGGAYLPGLDDNFLADRVATFPLIHLVQFDSNQKIRQIRLYWDQGSLLKQLDVIGSRGRNWPVRDGKDQSRLISSSVASYLEPTSLNKPNGTNASNGDPNGVTITTRAKSNSNAMNDPHATLSLFEPRDINQEAPKANTESPNVARRMSAKPPARDLSELFASGEDDVATPTPAAATAARERSISPSKRNAIPTKAGAGKHHSSNRLFDENDEPDPRTSLKSPEHIKTYAGRYNHFEFGDGEDAAVATERKDRPKSTHASHWDFEDFVTPQKPGAHVRPNDQRHFGWSDDEADAENAAAVSVPKRPVVHQPRRDAKAHFEFGDDGTPLAQKPAPRTNAMNKGLGLYENHVTGDEEEGNKAAKSAEQNGASAGGPLTEAKTTYINAGHRRKDFAPHWEMTDTSPGPAQSQQQQEKDEGKKAEPRKKALPSQMQSHWTLYETSPEDPRATKLTTTTTAEAEAGKENARAGSGAGIEQKVGTKVGKQMQRSWDFGDDGDTEDAAPIDRRARGGKTTAAGGGEKSFWDF